MLPGMMPGLPPAGGSRTFTANGSFTVPVFSKMEVELAGEGGNQAVSLGEGAFGPGTPGGQTKFDLPTGTDLVANGGLGGDDGAPGADGSASGGDTNTTGGAPAAMGYGQGEAGLYPGGNGAYCKKTYTGQSIAAGVVVTITVNTGGARNNALVKVTWS